MGGTTDHENDGRGLIAMKRIPLDVYRLIQDFCSLKELYRTDRFFWETRSFIYYHKLTKMCSLQYYISDVFRQKVQERVDDISRQLSLNLSHCDGIIDMSVLEGVNSVNLSHCSEIVDVSALRSFSSVNLSHCPGVKDMSILRDVKVTGSDGAIYKGGWEGTKRHGKGTIVYSNGDAYEGDFLVDNMHGKGKCTYARGDVYEGDYQDDKRHGKCKFTGARGDVYEGDYQDDKRHGKCKFTGARGDVYEGDCQDDNLHGK